MLYYTLSILVSIFSALIAKKLKIPAYILVGGILGVSIFNIFTEMAYSPEFNKFFLQVVSGSYIGSTINKDDLKNLKYIIKPTIIMIIGMGMVNIFMGSIIHVVTDIDYLTLLLSTIPGGVTETVLVAQAMNAQVSIVAIMQLFRSVISIIIFPIVIKKIIDKKEISSESCSLKVEQKEISPKNLFLTLSVGSLGGIFSYFFQFIPAATLIFSLLFVTLLNIKYQNAVVSKNFKKMAQVATGVFVGAKVNMATISALNTIFIPVTLMLLGYLVFHILLALFISSVTKVEKDVMLFSCIPAGASDIALIASSFNCDNPYISIFQIIRLITCILIYPYFDFFIASIIFI